MRTARQFPQRVDTPETRFLPETGFLRYASCHPPAQGALAGLIVVAALLTVARPVTAQSGDEELAHGLLATYSDGSASARRIDADIAFVWDDAAPDTRVPQGPFTAEWSGQLLIRDQTSYTFHAYVEGSVEVRLNDQVVLSADRTEAGWVSGAAVPSGFGFWDLVVNYRRTGKEGRVQLYWSSERFPLEPLPGHLLFLEEAQPQLAQVEHGRQLYDAYRCNRCHRDENELLSPPGPDLNFVTTGLNPEWLLSKLQHRHAEAASSRMPAFGFSQDDARALAAFLIREGRSVDLLKVPKVKEDSKNPLPEGDLLVNSAGCLACHRVGELGSPGPFGGGDLSQIGNKRSREWIHTQLVEPTRINQHARMPVFQLTDAERVQLVDALVRLGHTEQTRFKSDKPDDAALVERGRDLFDKARCAACHQLGDRKPDLQRVPGLNPAIGEWGRSCLAETPDREIMRPAFPEADRAALQAYVMSRPVHPSPIGQFAAGRMVLARRNCLACHERDGGTGIVASAGHVATHDARLAGQSQALIPPNLSAVGDKLLDEALAAAVSGEQKSRRLPWLNVRMPRFRHTEEEKGALLAYLVGHDRIPANAPAIPKYIGPDRSDAEMLMAGRTLVGATGFSCIACHEFGDYVPPNVPIATHGCDLLGLAQRMRPEYFVRWTRSPLRVVPGIEMPSYERSVPAVLDNKADTQLKALWKALNDPRFTVPTNPTVVEQLITVLPGDRPRVVRDVFTVSRENGGGYVPRALAVGFENGHSMLFDLDHACVRDWTYGDFARERTQGKSWFWDLAGTTVTGGFDAVPGLVLRDDSDYRWIAPAADEAGRTMRLHSYRQIRDTTRWKLRIEYEVVWQVRGQRVPVQVVEDIGAAGEWPVGDEGWARIITAQGVPDGYTLAITRPKVEPGEFRVFEGRGPFQVDMATWFPVRAGWSAKLFKKLETKTQETSLYYFCDLYQPERKSSPRPEWPTNETPVTTAPGFDGVRLKLPASIMPTSLNWTADGTLVFTSLKGHVFLARDTDGDGIEDALMTFEEGLAAPFGVLPEGNDLFVAHKPELLRLRDTDGDGRCDERFVVADGWGYTHDYHDWTTGPVRDRAGNLYLTLSSDYQQAERDRATTKWRGKVLRLDTRGNLEAIAHELRFPIGIALDAEDRLFVSDQQGVQNTFNEIDHIIDGKRYGVPALSDPPREGDETRANIQVPHPWTRSVNGIFFFPGPANPRDAVPESKIEHRKSKIEAFAGHGIGCEYNGRFLVRFTLQEVDGALQGAVYEFTSTTWDDENHTFLGPICGGVSPAGDICIGSIFDSGWLGGRNTGEIVRLRPNGKPLPNGIREVRAVPGGFELQFIHPVDPRAAAQQANYTVSGHTRVWEGAYATPDSGRYAAQIKSVDVSADAMTVTLHVSELREQYVYDVTCGPIGVGDDPSLHPAAAAYTMNRIPQ
jgi:mono/diheme cytochrome c family protein